MRKFLLVFSCLSTGFVSNLAMAQEQPENENLQTEFIESEFPIQEFDPSMLSSVLLTYWEYSEIEEAKKLIGKIKTPDTETDFSNDRKPAPEERYVHLQGILYSSKNDWIVWVNGKQIKPDALPVEALSMDVFKDYIEIRWYDDYTNQIFPLRLRPLQRFHMDTRMFLPG